MTGRIPSIIGACASARWLSLVQSTLAVVIATAASALMPVAALAKPKVTEQIAYYEVTGTTIQELRNSIRRNSTAHGYDAYTQWYVDWRFNWEPAGHRCRITSADVTVRVKIDFPKLVSEDDTPSEIVESWEGYADALMAHERNHGRNGIQPATKIERMLESLSIKGRCDGIESVGNARATAIIGEANQIDLDYDAETSHGANEGVVLE